MRRCQATGGWCADECSEVDLCIVLDQSGDWPAVKTSEDGMNDLLTALHLAVVMLDLRIKMMQAIREGQFEYAMTLHLLILVRSDELDAYKWAMSSKAWAIYETIHP